MARKTGPKMKAARRIGQPIYFTAKEAKTLARRGFAPGMHGQESGRRLSGYGLQLKEKQKAKLTYGVLERQFRKYFEQAFEAKGDTGELLLQSLERRLDNVVYRSGMATTRAQARQLVNHGHMHVNGTLVDIPSFKVRVGDVVSIRPQSQTKKYWEPIKKSMEQHEAPVWLQVDKEKVTAKVLALPTRQDIEHNIEPQLIVEFYSR
jgi:small subunit ribosomal protein S4